MGHLVFYGDIIARRRGIVHQEWGGSLRDFRACIAAFLIATPPELCYNNYVYAF